MDHLKKLMGDNISRDELEVCAGTTLVSQALSAGRVIYPDFPLELTGFFQGKHLLQFLVLKM